MKKTGNSPLRIIVTIIAMISVMGMFTAASGYISGSEEIEAKVKSVYVSKGSFGGSKKECISITWNDKRGNAISKDDIENTSGYKEGDIVKIIVDTRNNATIYKDFIPMMSMFTLTFIVCGVIIVKGKNV